MLGIHQENRVYSLNGKDLKNINQQTQKKTNKQNDVFKLELFFVYFREVCTFNNFCWS